METVAENLKRRKVDPSHPHVFVDEAGRVATFLLFNTTGKFVGYQTYRPDESNKKAKNHPKEGRYYTYVVDEGDANPRVAKKHLAVWGVDSVKKASWNNPLFVTEGIFDAAQLQSLGFAAVAVLQNNPKKLKSWMRALATTTVAVCDGDDAGAKLGNMTDTFVTCPFGHDVSSLGETNLDKLKSLLSMGLYKARN